MPKADKTWHSILLPDNLNHCNAKSRNAARLRSRAGGSEEAETQRIDQLAEAIQIALANFSMSSTVQLNHLLALRKSSEFELVVLGLRASQNALWQRILILLIDSCCKQCSNH